MTGDVGASLGGSGWSVGGIGSPPPESVATYAALRTALAAGTYQAGQMVFVEGRTDAGDGGQGMGQVVAIGSLTDDGGVTLTGGSLAWVRARPAMEYVDRWYGVVADGSTVDTAAYQALEAAVTAGSMVRLAGAGTRIIDAEIEFDATDLTFIADPGVVLKKADSSEALDRVIHLSGDRATWTGGEMDANLAGNTGTITGRAELLKISGDDSRLSDIILRGSHDVSFSCALIVQGKRCVVDRLTTYDTGRDAIREQGDDNSYRDIRLLDCVGGPSDSCHAFVKDSAPSGAFNSLTVDGLLVTGGGIDSFEGFLVDHDGVQGNRVSLRNAVIDCPGSTGPDVIKFAYVKNVILDNLWVKAHDNASAAASASLRIQQSVDAVDIRGSTLAGGIDFDATGDCKLRIDGRSVLGDEITCTNLIGDFRGTLIVDDGATFKNVGSYVVTLENTAAAIASKINIGRAHYSGTGSARIANVVSALGADSKRRVIAGMVSVAEPLSQSGFRVYADGSWITDSDTRDAASAQGGHRSFVATRSDIPPRDSEGWKLGDVIRDRTHYAYSQGLIRCIGDGAGCRVAWAGSTAYSVGNWVYNGSNVYVCAFAGTSASSGGPTGTGTGIADGGATWNYVAPLAQWSGSLGSSIPADTAANIASAGANVNAFDKFAGKLVRDTTNNRVMCARGAAATDAWDVADGSASVTPV